MRKLALTVTFLALCLFTVFSVAQTPGGTTGPDPNSPRSSDRESPNGSHDTVKNPENAGSTSDQASNSATSASGEKTLEGCIVKEQADYFIQPMSGERERLTGSQDFASHVGHEVTLHGNEQSSSAANASGSSTTTASNSTSGNADRTPTSGTSSAESQNNAAGSIAGNAGSSNATGSAAPSSNSTWTGKDFMVTKVDMVSESCPADIQKKIDENKSK